MDGQLFKGLALTLPVFKVGQRYLPQVAAVLLLLDGEHLVEAGNREGTEDDRVHDAEAGGIGADAKGQRKNGSDCESRRLAQLAQCVAQVLKHGLHGSLRPS